MIRSNSNKLLAATLLTLAIGVVNAEPSKTLNGHVTKVFSGDTLQVTDETGRHHRIRLIGIDAPNTRQTYAQYSTRHLMASSLDKPVQVLWEHKDRKGMILGSVRINGGSVNLSQIEHGCAWFYPAHAQYLDDTVLTYYQDAQAKAKKYRLGLWFEDKPTEPWLFHAKPVKR